MSAGGPGYIWPAVRAQLGHGNQQLAELIPALRRHLEFEETQVWPEMRKAFSPLQARELGNKVAGAAGPTAARPKGRKPADSAEAAAGKLNGAVSRRRTAG